MITARDRDGHSLFPVGRAEWNLPAGPRSIAVASDGVGIDFPYVYVPEAATALSWRPLRNPRALCGNPDLAYRVTVFDQHSRLGPAHEVSRIFTLPVSRPSSCESLNLQEFRSQIVNIRLSSVSAIGKPGWCVGWSDLRMTHSPAARVRGREPGERARQLRATGASAGEAPVSASTHACP